MMELLPTLLTLSAMGVFAAAYYWLLRRKGNRFPWLGGREERQIELLDRLPLTHQHSLHLVALKGRWLAIAVTPQGCQLLESGEEKQTPSTEEPCIEVKAFRAGGRL